MKTYFYHDQILEICLGNHLTVDDIFERLQKDNPDIGRSTVYRNVEELLQQKKMKKIIGAQKKALFETATKSHAHFICKDDGTVRDIDLPDLNLDFLSMDCEIEDIDLRIYGRKKS